MRRLLGLPVPYLVIAVLGAIVLLGIPLVTDTFITFLFANVAVYVIALMGLNLLTGYSGQISLGNGAFMAVGAYTTALLVHRLHISYYATIPLAGLVAGLFGFLFGFPALRLSGIYLALATFALALAVTPVINNFDTFTEGHTGINMKPAHAPALLQLSDEQWLYFLCWAVAAVMFVISWNIIRSSTGRAFMAIRDSETAATASGVSLSYYKTLAFALSALFSGVAGALLAIVAAYVNPDNFSLQLSLNLLVGLVVGGLGFRFGPVIGGVVVVFLPYYSEKIATLQLGPFMLPPKPDIFNGILLLLILFFAPSGVIGLIMRGFASYSARRSAAHGEEAEIVAAESILEEN